MQKPLNQELFSIRFAVVSDFVTDLVVFDGAARMDHRMFRLGQSWGHLWDALHSPPPSSPVRLSELVYLDALPSRDVTAFLSCVSLCRHRLGASNLQPSVVTTDPSCLFAFAPDSLRRRHGSNPTAESCLQCS